MSKPAPSDRVRQLLAELQDAVVAASAEGWAGTGWHYLADVEPPTTRPFIAWTTDQTFALVEWRWHRTERRFTFISSDIHGSTQILAWHELPPPPPKPSNG